MSIISIDYFGTLNQRPAFWQEFMKFAKLEGTKINVISGLWEKALTEKLEFSGFTREVHYDSVYSILSHLSKNGIDIWFDENQDSWYSAESAQNDWWDAKAEICQEINCKMHFDNDLRFGKAFENVATRFVHTNRNNMKLIRQWSAALKLANTFDDWEDDYMSMFSGLMPGQL